MAEVSKNINEANIGSAASMNTKKGNKIYLIIGLLFKKQVKGI